MIINMVGGGGGAALNFKVVPGLTQPGTASENTIWVKTERIGSWYFSATQPEGLQEWDVWFTVGTSSAVEFNALKKGGIQVYPISPKQYVGGALVNVTSYIYQNGEWELISGNYLYHKGKYVVPFDKWLFQENIGIINDNSDHVLLSRTQESDSQIGWWSSGKINLSKSTKLYAEVLCSDAGVLNQYGDWRFRFGAFSGKVSTNLQSTANMLACTTFTADKTKTVYEVPLNDIGEAYVGIQGTGIAEVYDIWWE